MTARPEGQPGRETLSLRPVSYLVPNGSTGQNGVLLAENHRKRLAAMPGQRQGHIRACNVYRGWCYYKSSCAQSAAFWQHA